MFAAVHGAHGPFATRSRCPDGFVRASEERRTIRPGSLARLLRMPASSLSQALKPLEDKGYVKRERLRDDARTVSIELTEHGWGLAEQCQYEMHALITEFCNTIGVDEIEDLMASLDKVLEFANSYGRPTRV